MSYPDTEKGHMNCYLHDLTYLTELSIRSFSDQEMNDSIAKQQTATSSVGIHANQFAVIVNVEIEQIQWAC